MKNTYHITSQAAGFTRVTAVKASSEKAALASIKRQYPHDVIISIFQG
jgi:hypothetical protein